MPKKGLMAMPGTISASGSDGFGLMQIPPVSEKQKQSRLQNNITGSSQCGKSYKIRQHLLYFQKYFSNWLLLPLVLPGNLRRNILHILVLCCFGLPLNSLKASDTALTTSNLSVRCLISLYLARAKPCWANTSLLSNTSLENTHTHTRVEAPCGTCESKRGALEGDAADLANYQRVNPA